MGSDTTIPAEAQAVLDFWFRESTPEQWFKKDDAFDAAIQGRFGALHERAAAGELDGWKETAAGCLALIILLDQFPRNMFRGEARAFATDPAARAMTRHALEKGLDEELDKNGKTFLYLPLEHSEDRADQARCVDLFTALGDAELLKYAVAHKEIIDRFGRFPHRNAALDRETTPEEAEFLSGPNSSF